MPQGGMTTILVLTAAKKQTGERVEVSVKGLTEIEIQQYLKQEKELHETGKFTSPGGLFAHFEDPKIEYCHLVEKQYAGPCDDVCTVAGWFRTSMTRAMTMSVMEARELQTTDLRIEWESPLRLEHGKWEYIDWSFVLVD